jgi:hypothetical protein
VQKGTSKIQQPSAPEVLPLAPIPTLRSATRRHPKSKTICPLSDNNKSSASIKIKMQHCIGGSGGWKFLFARGWQICDMMSSPQYHALHAAVCLHSSCALHMTLAAIWCPPHTAHTLHADVHLHLIYGLYMTCGLFYHVHIIYAWLSALSVCAQNMCHFYGRLRGKLSTIFHLNFSV